MIHESTPVGSFQCNCHVLGCENSKEGIILDPGDEAKRIIAMAKDAGIQVKAILHTHCHLDHIAGTRDVKTAFPDAEIWIHSADAPLYQNLVMQASAFGWDVSPPLAPDRTLADGDEIAFGKHTLKVMHTPGHTPGSCCFALEDKARVLFSGDTLFARSVGRTDLWGGDFDQEIASIRARILTLPDDTVVYPGHGPETRIGEERRKNPFLT